MESSTKTYLVGKGAKTLVGNNVTQNSLDISKSATQIYHIVPSCAYIINNTDGTAAPQEFSFFLFKKENDTILDVTKQTEFLIQYTVGETNGEFKIVSNKLKETDINIKPLGKYLIICINNKSIGTFGNKCKKEKIKEYPKEIFGYHIYSCIKNIGNHHYEYFNKNFILKDNNRSYYHCLVYRK